ncbi:armadillo repeat kinesin [Trifolium repens]|nr:armadillo repeat kinesin [Trifolium repens]
MGAYRKRTFIYSTLAAVVPAGSVVLCGFIELRNFQSITMFLGEESPHDNLMWEQPESNGVIISKHQHDQQELQVISEEFPRNAEESVADADFADCVELQPEENEQGAHTTTAAASDVEVLDATDNRPKRLRTNESIHFAQGDRSLADELSCSVVQL